VRDANPTGPGGTEQKGGNFPGSMGSHGVNLLGGWSGTTLRSCVSFDPVRDATTRTSKQGRMQAAARQVASRLLRGGPQKMEAVQRRGFAAGEPRSGTTAHGTREELRTCSTKGSSNRN